MAEVDLNELERYLRIFQENPDSRVFAPLADLYRRLSRLKEAEEICREGIQRHPYYAGGRVALAHVLLDALRLEEALKEAESVVTYYPDNLLARKILIRVLGGIGNLDRARREFEALRHLAPQIAGDPELERALQGPMKSRDLPMNPVAAPIYEQKQVFKPIEIQEKTVWDPGSADRTLHLKRPGGTRTPFPDAQENGRVERERRLQKLLREKLILETWLRVLGSSPSLR